MKTERVELRLTRAEKDKYQRLAHYHGLTLSDYLRFSAEVTGEGHDAWDRWEDKVYVKRSTA